MATGQMEIDQALSDEFESLVETVAFAQYKKDLFSKLETHKPHLLIVGDALAMLEEDPPRETFLQEIRRLYPGTRIIYIYDGTMAAAPQFISYLTKLQIYDFVNAEEVDVQELQTMIASPRGQHDIRAYQFPAAATQSSGEETAADGKSEAEAKSRKERNPEPKVITETIYREKEVLVTQKQQIILFYAPAPTGKSVVSQNTAVYLAKNLPSIEIALVDFDFSQPKIATRMRLNQKHKLSQMYLDELLQAIDGNRFDGKMLREYMFSHPKYENLKIFNGEFRRQEYADLLDNHHVEAIFDVLKEEFGTILLDVNRDLEMIGNDICFKKATVIYNVLDYDFSHCMEFVKTRKLWSRIPFIRKKPKRIVINKAIDNPKFSSKLLEAYFETDNDIIEDSLDLKPVNESGIPMLYEQQINAIQEGYSLVERDSKVTESFRHAIHEVAVSIHPCTTDEANPSFFQKLKLSFVAKRTQEQHHDIGITDDV